MSLQWKKPDLDQLAKDSQSWCPFCPEKVKKITPRFPKEILPEGRMESGDMVLFPNLAPYDAISAVATLGDRHFVPLNEFSPEQMAKGFRLALDFCHKLRDVRHPEAIYFIINWNYMPHAGSSILHPHIQIIVSADAPNLMRQELVAAKAYQEKHGSNYWEDLVRIEKEKNERYLTRIGRTDWFMAFTPMGAAGDVEAVVEDARYLLDLTDTDLLDLGTGLSKAMKAYDRMGVYSFNMNFFTGAEKDDHARVHLLFSPRISFNQAIGTSDTASLQHLYNETFCMAFPEEIRDMIQEDF